MLKDLIRIMRQEMVLFEAAISTERDKRKYILSANGYKLQHLTRKTETYLAELGLLEKKRLEAARDIVREMPEVDEDVTLSSLLMLLKDVDPAGWKEFSPLSDRYRELGAMLRAETEENSRLLASTAQSIDRVMGNLRDLAGAKEKETTYAPESPSRKSRGGSVLLNTNA